MDSIISAVKNQYKYYQDNKIIPKLNFKEKHNFEKRQEEAIRILEKYPNRVPIICERLTRKAPEIDRSKYLCPRDLTMGNFMYVIRKRLHLSQEKALYLFINNSIVPVSKDLGTIYEEKKEKDGFLYIRYDSESTFG
tara:strand:- start:919 stop:1329 length:411 start_codon:yes stop_codon:yes gene_type:complete